ncbi:MAG: carbohydrate ABC transporter permease [Ignavibacteriaceae bacterium]
MNKKRIKNILIFSLLTIVAVMFIIPFLWVLSTSLKPESAVFSLQWFPETWKFDNYLKVFEKIPFLPYLKNSVVISLLTIIGTVLSSSIVAYAFGCLEWPGRNTIFIFIIATMMLPLQVIMIPLFIMFKELGWLNTIKPLTIPAFFGGGAFNIFLLRQFFLSIPKSLLDAARIDGCSELRIYWSIVLPLAKPALATVAIITFMFAWNDFLGPLIYLSEKAQGTLALGIAQYAGQMNPEYSVLMAASVLMMLPIIIIFFMFQKYFIQAFTMSGIKE